MNTTVTVGGMTLDTLLPIDQKIGAFAGNKLDVAWIETAVGGGAANSATILARLGRKVSIHCSVGADNVGCMLLQELQDRGIDTNAVEVYKSKSTGRAVIFVDHCGEVTIKADRGANLLFEGAKIDSLSCDLMYVSSAPEHIYARIQHRRDNLPSSIKFTAINPGMRQILNNRPQIDRLLQTAELLIMNADEAQKYAERLKPGKNRDNLTECITTIGLHRTGVTCVTNGAQGAWFFFNGNIHFQSAEKLGASGGIVNVVGAGDAFGATLSHFLARNVDLQIAAKYASENAAHVVGKKDACSGALDRTHFDSKIY